MGADPTSVTSHVTIILFTIHPVNKEIKKKQFSSVKNIQTLWHAMTLAQEEEIKLKKHEALNDDDPSIM